MKRSAQSGTNVGNEFFQRPLSDFKSIKLDIDRACFSFQIRPKSENFCIGCTVKIGMIEYLSKYGFYDKNSQD